MLLRFYNKILKVSVFLAILAFILSAPFLTFQTANAQAASASLEDLGLTYVPSDRTLRLNYSIEHKNTRPLQLRVSAVLKDGQGRVINSNVFRNGAAQFSIPVSSTFTTTSNTAGYRPSGVTQAAQAVIIWSIVDTGTNQTLVSGTRNISPIPTSGTTPGGNPGSTTNPGTNPSSGTGNSGDCYKYRNTIFGDNICADTYFASFYKWAVAVAILAAAIMVIYAGYKYTTSNGNQGVIGEAKEMIISVMVGLLLLLLSYTILKFLGINLIS